MTIFLSCVKKKKNYTTIAKELYDSCFFKKQLEYALSLKPENIFILSAKYGVLELSDIVSPYEQTLNKMSQQERCQWGDKVVHQLMNKNFNFNEKTIFLCGEKYRLPILHHFNNIEIPLKGMSIGKQLQWLSNNTK